MVFQEIRPDSLAFRPAVAKQQQATVWSWTVGSESNLQVTSVKSDDQSLSLSHVDPGYTTTTTTTVYYGVGGVGPGSSSSSHGHQQQQSTEEREDQHSKQNGS